MSAHKLNKSKASTLILLMLIFFSAHKLYAEKWRGPAHLGISTVGTFVLSEIPTLITDKYKIHNLYLFSGTIMLAAGLGKEAYDEIVPDKKISWEDIGLDLIGITLGITSHYFLTERKKKKIEPSLYIDKNGFNLATNFFF